MRNSLMKRIPELNNSLIVDFDDRFKDFDNTFRRINEYFGKSPIWHNSISNFNNKQINIYDENNIRFIEMILPKYKKENISIDIVDGFLRIECADEENKEESDKKFIQKSYSASSFQQLLKLESSLDVENIEASMENGVLLISIPHKKEEIKENKKTIKIK